MDKENASAQHLLPAVLLERWPYFCNLKIMFGSCNTNQLFCFYKNKVDEMPCKLGSTENPILFEKYPTLPKGGVGYFSNECRFSVESSLQHISSNFWL